MPNPTRTLPWLESGEPFPPVTSAWSQDDPAPGLLASGRTLDVTSLLEAYALGIFPWFSAGQPILWWSPEPRMVLRTGNFRLHRSLRKSLQRFLETPGCEIRMDTAFDQVINACAGTARTGQPGTWIVPDMVEAYTALHAAGHAHSVETWSGDQLVGGLYCVNIGTMVFGESMFSHQTDASKFALAGLVAFSRAHGLELIDCQQNTRHLASMGAAEIPRADFVAEVAAKTGQTSPIWNFDALYWQQLLPAGMQNPTTT
ncbi:MAG: leucyl/phenylalanyl-tRNA--protein transferase [Polaromonas sp.]|nr:leucyl/phenylalanyl-tRNA--protein transferase [Polaromonas sp.]